MLSLFPPSSPPWSENSLQVPMDFGSQQQNIGFCGRVVVLSVLSLLLYPFLWGWTVIGTIWFTRAKSCLPEDGQKWGSEFRVQSLAVPDWAFEAAGQELRSMSQDAATYHPGLYLTPAQTEAFEALIQELPKFRLKAVPDDCGECLICLEEFQIGHEEFDGVSLEHVVEGRNRIASSIAQSVTRDQRYQSYVATGGPSWLSSLLREEEVHA